MVIITKLRSFIIKLRMTVFHIAPKCTSHFLVDLTCEKIGNMTIDIRFDIRCIMSLSDLIIVWQIFHVSKNCFFYLLLASLCWFFCHNVEIFLQYHIFFLHLQLSHVLILVSAGVIYFYNYEFVFNLLKKKLQLFMYFLYNLSVFFFLQLECHFFTTWM